MLEVRDDVDAYARALHGVERRIVRIRTISGPGRSREQRALPSPAEVDPWTIDVSALADASRVVAWCPSCLGSGAATCVACRGAGKMRCPRCEGAGIDGAGAACKQCDGAKKLPCAECQGARLPCAECQSSGEVTAWLEVERSTRPVVIVHPMGAAARAHPAVSEVADFDREPSRFVAARVEDTGERPAGAAPAELLPARLEPGERVVTTRIQRFQAVRSLVTYGTALAAGVVVVGGSPSEVEPGADWRPIELRRHLTLAFGAVALGLDRKSTV